MTVHTAKTVVLDIANNYGGDWVELRSVDFYLNGELIPIGIEGIRFCGASDYYEDNLPECAFITSLPKVSWSEEAGFATDYAVENIRLVCTFMNPIEFDQIVINNGHYEGYGTIFGVRDVKIYTALVAFDHDSDLVYGEPITDSKLIFDGTFREHVEGDVEDPETLILLGDSTDSGPDIPIALAQAFYACTITGTENNLSDLVVPISSFRSRRRSGSPSYLQVVVPGLDRYDDIVLRPAGDVVINMTYSMGEVIISQGEIARVNMGTVNYQKSSQSGSITLSGSKQTTYTSGKTVPLSNVTWSSFNSGTLRVGLAVPDLDLNPGDTVAVGGLSFTAELITTTVSISANGTITSGMEISGL
ncbi:hypothetical protein [Desulfoluna spongiiphila]|uniref:Uncharacterized protein n=1 Tax=Desulfoluna spongiiphila TaxID=419481 RepID=A0A1G5FZA6_9BACT|nr:hypothetical protein [Desulfoluna spongiiphila]SCY44645.1 hypothetical protein SAMN05216233_109106 [Desulfoluna spongiiphila]